MDLPRDIISFKMDQAFLRRKPTKPRKPEPKNQIAPGTGTTETCPLQTANPYFSRVLLLADWLPVSM